MKTAIQVRGALQTRARDKVAYRRVLVQTDLHQVYPKGFMESMVSPPFY